MRSTLLLAIAAVFAATTSSACMDAVEDGSYSARRGAARKSPPRVDDDDEDEEHDPDDAPGATSTDPGNPNADTRPAPPTTTGTEAREFGISLSNNTPTVDLGESTTIDVTIEPKGGFTGPVELAVTGLPTGVTAAPTTANVTGGPATAKLTLQASYNTPVTPANENVPLVVVAKSGDAQATANANFKVAPRVKITIPVNVDALRGASQLRSEYGEAFGPDGQPLLTQPGNGIVVTIFNADSKPHVIHGPGGSFPHGNTGAPIQPNSFEMAGGNPRTRTLNVGANVTAYLHDGNGGQGASFRIRVAQAP